MTSFAVPEPAAKLITLRMAAQNTETALARALHGRCSCADEEAYALIREASPPPETQRTRRRRAPRPPRAPDRPSPHAGTLYVFRTPETLRSCHQRRQDPSTLHISPDQEAAEWHSECHSSITFDRT